MLLVVGEGGASCCCRMKCSTFSKLIVYVPDITRQGIGSTLDSPSCQSKLVLEQNFVKGRLVGLQEAQMVQHCLKGVRARAKEDVPKRSVLRRDVWREEVVFHLKNRETQCS